MDYVTLCPACRQALKLPAEAIGQSGHCPYCKREFRVPKKPNGSPGEPILTRRPLGIPVALFVPAFGLLMLGLAGVLVNARIALLCEFDGDAPLAYARLMVREERLLQNLTKSSPSDGTEFDIPAALVGVPASTLTSELLDESLAQSRASKVKDRMWQFTGVSTLVLLGGLAVIFGRFYPVAILGCIAAALNFNHNCFIPGAVVGLWGILMLVRDDVRPHFRR